jgi:hypothetical protein
MTEEGRSGMDLEGSGLGIIEVISRNVWWDSGKPQNTSIRIVAVPAEIRTEQFPNTSLEAYLQTHPTNNNT